MNRTQLSSCSRFLMTAAVLLFTLIFAASAWAQLSGKGTIRGTVTDKTGAVIPGATVTAVNAGTNIATTTTTTSTGNFELSTLNPGDYTVNVAASGFEGFTQKNVHVNALDVTNLSPALTNGSAATTVTVSEAPPAIETTNATLGATMENAAYSSLPLEMGGGGNFDQRRSTDFVNLMPGVAGNETNGNSTTNVGVINGSGSRGAAAAVYVAGIPFTRAAGEGDPRFVWTALPVDSVDQFQVLTTGEPAMYEGQGVVNMTVKSGTNQYHGYIYDVIRNTAFDTWGFFNPALPSATGGAPVKPTEHENEYGVVVSGPAIHDKLFFFANYMGYRLDKDANPTYQTQPTAAERGQLTATSLPGTTNANFQDMFGATTAILFDPTTLSCVGSACTRTAYGSAGAYNIIPMAKMSAVAKALLANLPANTNTALSQNYLAGVKNGLSNWSGTLRADYAVRANNQLSFLWLVGRQESLGPDGHQGPAGQTTAGRNVGPLPYNYGQVYAPKTLVYVLQDAHSFTPHLTNQFNYGYARYYGPTFNPTMNSPYTTTALGYSGVPAGQGANSFPTVTFADKVTGVTSPTTWAGNNANIASASDYALVDNVQWVKGAHVITAGISLQWMEYQNTQYTTGESIVTLANSYNETGQFTSGGSTPNGTTGDAFASFLAGAPDSVSLTYNNVPETGARFHPVSPYLQDTWKATKRLTVDAGIRWDYFPPYREVRDHLSFLNPTGVNTLATGSLGTLQFAGSAITGDSTGNHTPVNTFMGNFGPRLGVAYKLDDKTVLRASYGVMYTHGGGIGGGANSASGTGITGYAAPTKSTWAQSVAYATVNTSTSNPVLDLGFPGQNTSQLLSNTSPTYGTGYCTTNLGVAGGCLASPLSMNYGDTYLGGRAPQYVNWSFGFQREINSATTLTVNYVGSEGHFVQEDTANGHGQWINQMQPQYLAIGTALGNSATATNITNALASQSLTAQNLATTNNYDSTNSEKVYQALLPFPQYGGVADTYGYYGNTNYHGLQMSLQRRQSHGLMYMVNYTYSKSIDDAGAFRYGYDFPSAYLYGATAGRTINHYRIERSESTSSQRQHLVMVGTYALPFGTGKLGGDNVYLRDAFGGFHFSSTFQSYSGSPLALTSSNCGTNKALTGTCLPFMNAAYTGSGHINGHWGQGITAANPSQYSYLDSSAFLTSTQVSSLVTYATPYLPNAPRTAPLHIIGPGNYDLDISLSRSIPLHYWGAKFTITGQLFNVTNHTQFTVASTQVGNASFGQVNGQANTPRQAQFEGKLEF